MSNVVSIYYVAESDDTNPIAWMTDREGPKAEAATWLLRAFGGPWSESYGCRIMIEGMEAISFSFWDTLSKQLQVLGFTILKDEIIDQEN